MNAPDISTLNYHDLNELRTAVGERMKEMRETGITQLRATIAEQASELGIALEELFPKKRRRKRRKHVDDGDETAGS